MAFRLVHCVLCLLTLAVFASTASASTPIIRSASHAVTSSDLPLANPYLSSAGEDDDGEYDEYDLTDAESGEPVGGKVRIYRNGNVLKVVFGTNPQVITNWFRFS